MALENVSAETLWLQWIEGLSGPKKPKIQLLEDTFYTNKPAFKSIQETW